MRVRQSIKVNGDARAWPLGCHRRSRATVAAGGHRRSGLPVIEAAVLPFAFRSSALPTAPPTTTGLPPTTVVLWLLSHRDSEKLSTEQKTRCHTGAVAVGCRRGTGFSLREGRELHLALAERCIERCRADVVVVLPMSSRCY
ncbi:uncharacterized protein G2W53_000131 [Senna tora]|uniref:Uncharacterized protein n=1 Tax=Senna tora TaxID=362788 RepID=A0A835CJ69_9FABA|nr:uncharacterized protein G2W53_000131 [Senna tora]